MNSVVETLNQWGARFEDFALPMLLQSSLLIVLLFALDLVLRNRVRAVVRYGLWILVLIKLVLPPSFAAPTGLAYWLPQKQAIDTARAPSSQFVVRYSDAKFGTAPPLPSRPAPRPKLQFAGWVLVGWCATALVLMAWLVRRSRSVIQTASQALPASDSPRHLLDACRQQMGIKRRVRLKLSATASTPAVSGLWRPVILIPQLLADKLSALQLRAVLLHELAHVKRGDVPVHYAQTLLQIFYWWHPLLWLANAHIRRVREQAVDEMVMVHMGEEAEAYPATLLEVARLAFQRPMLALGLVGIVESKSALALRIKRLLEGPVPKSAKLGILRLAIVAVVGALLLPMARGERKPANRATRFVSRPSANPVAVETQVKFISVPDTVLEDLKEAGPYTIGPNGHIAWMLPAEQRIELLRLLEQQPGVAVLSSQQVTTATAQETQVETAGIQPFQHPQARTSATCRITPYVSGSLIDLSVSAKITESGDLDSVFAGEPKPDQEPDDNGSGRVIAMNGVGNIDYDAGTAQTLVGDGGAVMLQNPALKDADGRRIVVVVSPRIVWQSASVAEPNSNTISVAASSSALRQSRVENNVAPAPMTKPTQAQPAGPAPKDNRSEGKTETLTVTIARTEPYLYLGSKPISLQDLEAELRRAASLNPAAILSLRADKDALFGEIVKVADAAMKAGIKSVTLITQPRVTRRDSVRATNTNGPLESNPGNAAPTKPSPANLSSTVRQNHGLQPDTTTLVQDGKVLYEMGRIDEAEARLKQATKQDPENQAAFYYLTLIEEARYAAGARKREALPTPNPFATTNLLNTGPGRQAIQNKLNRIVLDEAFFDSVALPQVLNSLSEEAAKRDPDKEGINFLINPMPSGAQTTIDPATGQQIALPPSGPLDMNSVVVRINPALKNIRLGDLLEAITKVADKPIRYSVEEYAVIFSQKTPEAAQLETRAFRVDPNAFQQALELVGMFPSGITGVTRTNLTQTIQDTVRFFFTAAGISVLPPNGVFYNGRTGVLLVRATAQELDVVQKAVETLNVAPQQITIEPKFMGMPTDAAPPTSASKELGFDWFLGNTLLSQGQRSSPGGLTGLPEDKPKPVSSPTPLETRVFRLDPNTLRENLQKQMASDVSTNVVESVRRFFDGTGVNVSPPNTVYYNDRTGLLMVRAAKEAFATVEKALAILNYSPPQITIEAKFMEMPAEAARKLGLDLPSPGATSNTWTRVLTAEQMQTVLRAASQVAGADILTDPKVTTLSGRQTQIQAVKIKTIVNGVKPEALTSPGAQSTNGVPAQPYVTGQIPVGPTLDMIAYVAADGYTIHLSAMPQVTEVLDALTASQFVPTVIIGAGGAQPGAPITGQLPLPIFRTRKLATSADVYDGQTLVLGNPMVTMVSQQHDGQSTTNTIPEVGAKRLLVFITSTIIDPAGNPIHAPGNEPFPPDRIPSQPSR